MKIATHPLALVVDGARRYQYANGMPTVETNPSGTVVDPDAIQDVAAAYNAMPVMDESALPAWHAMAEETRRQFDFLTRSVHQGGMGFDVIVSETDPYDTSAEGGTAEFFHDIENSRMVVLSTAATGSHDVFSDDVNDQFRAVHDVFGHGGTGRGVDRHGEEAAYRKHATMFSPLARLALATETRGQNHAMIAAGGVFQEQKISILPAWARRFAYVTPRSIAALHTSVTQARGFQRHQGLA
jgi:hypothetical protein